MPVSAIRSVYKVANDMNLMKDFDEAALELLLTCQNGDSWRQFKAPPAPVALNSSTEATEGGRGGVIIFDAIDLAAMTRRIERLSGSRLSSRDMGSRGSVATFATAKTISSSLHVPAGG